ncbi:uncharacterized protein LOC110037734 [Phalaenopsis equestris]|uniref:uncharacterized protein LOC110037734 n=1 Tax=Phalaenopsis equestris TaxID=78828 RepID=UPI0009E202B4|nr:uncharacterized protein LOC110037734 [Phalaenopsis equestris]
MKKAPGSDFKYQRNPNSDDLDSSFPASPPQISDITDNFSASSSNSVIAAAGDLDDAESSHPIISLLLENSSDQSGLPEFPPTPLVEPVGATLENVEEASISITAASFIEEAVEGEGSYAEKILTELSEGAAQPGAQIVMEKCSEMDGGEQNLEVALVGFSTAMEKLCDSIREVLLPAVEQWKRRNWIDGFFFFFLVTLGGMTLAFFIGAVLFSVLLTSVAPEGYLSLNSLPEFNRPTPT